MSALRGSVLGSSGRNGLPPSKPYRRFGNPGYDPAALGPMEKKDGAGSGGRAAQRQAREARIAEFARLRAEEGKTVAEASALLGVTWDTGREYERVLRQRKAAGS